VADGQSRARRSGRGDPSRRGRGGGGRAAVFRDPRALAVEAVRRITDQGAYSNRVIPSLLQRSNLPPGDRELAAELSYGTVRRRIPIDLVLGRLVDRPLAFSPPVARAALRVGAYQLLSTRVPEHAAVDRTVAVVAKRERGFVNAVLRRLVREGAEPPEGDDPEAISARTGVTGWAVEELRLLLGKEAEAAAEALAAPAGLTLRTNPCRAEPDLVLRAFREAGLDPEPGRIHPGSLRLPGGDPRGLPGWEEGWFTVQDEASSWVVDVLDPQPGERILDACAGPGGKSSDIACRAGGAVAGDLSERRARLVVQSAARLGVRALTLVQDARAPALWGGFDRVLVDAPCSGSGSARRRPELLWRPRREDLPALAELQLRIAVGAASLLRPGGVLVYSVCTFPRAETDEVAAALPEEVPGLRPDPFRDPDGDEAPTARLWPHRNGTDAMFAARFVLEDARD
jgi:16S rRNA (cytosine967-C5)-methyltransferase